MQHKTNTNTSPPPHLQLAATFKNEATHMTQALQDTEITGKEKPALLWIYHHNGAETTAGRHKKTPPLDGFSAQHTRRQPETKKPRQYTTIDYNILLTKTLELQ
jgi:hypothetical protein